MGDRELSHGLLQVWPMIFGIAVGDAHGLLIALRHIVAVEGKTGGIKIVETLVKAFLGTDGQGQCAEEHITAIRMEVIECTTERKPILVGGHSFDGSAFCVGASFFFAV